MGEALRVTYANAGSSRFMIGRDKTGHWVVCDVKGLVGGIFFDRSSAIHFARTESDHAPGAVCCAPEDVVLRLDPLFKPVPVTQWPQGTFPL